MSLTISPNLPNESETNTGLEKIHLLTNYVPNDVIFDLTLSHRGLLNRRIVMESFMVGDAGSQFTVSDDFNATGTFVQARKWAWSIPSIP